MSHNWNQAVLIDTPEGQTLYTTKSLVNLFRDLKREGYEALSLGLIIDLINRDAEVA